MVDYVCRNRYVEKALLALDAFISIAIVVVFIFIEIRRHRGDPLLTFLFLRVSARGGELHLDDSILCLGRHLGLLRRGGHTLTKNVVASGIVHW